MTKIDLEKVVLLIFFIVILFQGPGVLFDHQIKHDFPFAYFASDAFQHQVRAEAIKDSGNFRYEAPYISMGIENVVGRYPPAIYHLAVILSHSSGIEVYDSIYFIVVFFAIIASFIMYFIIRNFNKTVALLSLPLSLIIFSFPSSTGFLWGHWPSILSQSFLILFLWSIINLNLKKSYLIIAISLSAIVFTHMPPFIFAFIFLALFFGIKLLARKMNKEDIKNMVTAFAIFFIISFYYLVIFFNTWAKAQPYEFTTQPIWEGNPGFYLGGFGLLLPIILLGIIFSFPKLKDMHVALIAAFAMLLSGFTNYIGFDVRAFQIRFLWPIYLSVFMGLGIYILLKFLIKKWRFIYTSGIFAILIFAFSGILSFPALTRTDVQIIPYIPQLNRDTSTGVMNPIHWEALEWIKDNAEEDAKIYFFYGDIYSQDALLRNTKRFHTQVDNDEFINSLQERKIKRDYISETPGDSGGNIALRKSFFEFIDITKVKPNEFFFGSRDICSFDYLVFDKVSGQNVLAQYNLLIASELLKKDFIKAVFDNDIVIILKNNNIGVDCIEERSF
jgi:hypothetical protein|tara:strand:+ start:1972 stop:3645 length:1674 start_codon:yes stop_codon:yes gene_type:complete